MNHTSRNNLALLARVLLELELIEALDAGCEEQVPRNEPVGLPIQYLTERRLNGVDIGALTDDEVVALEDAGVPAADAVPIRLAAR